MTTKQLIARHEKGERILDMIRSAEVMKGLKEDTVRLMTANQWNNSLCDDAKARIISLDKTIDRLRHYYYNTMEIVPTETVAEIVAHAVRKTELYGNTWDAENHAITFETEDYRIEFNYTAYYHVGEFSSIDVNFDELYHDRKVYSAEEIDELKLLLLEELTAKANKDL